MAGFRLKFGNIYITLDVLSRQLKSIKIKKPRPLGRGDNQASLMLECFSII